MLNYKALLFVSLLVAAGQANPTLTLGVWKNISPPQLTFTGVQGNGTSFVNGMAVDATNPSTIYLCSSNFNGVVDGLYKTTDGGSNWRRIGKVDKPIYPGAGMTIDQAIRVRVDPRNPQHVYCGDGVRGTVLGFWVSNDGGENFTMPEGFATWANTIGTLDMYDIAVDPTDFNHVLLTFHYWWRSTDAGVAESKDGGVTWISHPPAGGWGCGHSVSFLKNSTSWLVGTQSAGYWRTSNSGSSWTKVSSNNIAHGGGQIYYAKTGILYASHEGGVMRSSDDGITWTSVGTATFCNAVYGDGDNLYTHHAWGGGPEPFYVSPESDGAQWTAFNGGTQKYSCGPFEMAFDPVNRILYSSNWADGLLALKVSGGTSIAGVDRSNTRSATRSSVGIRASLISDRQIVLERRSSRTIERFDVKGKLLRKTAAGGR